MNASYQASLVNRHIRRFTGTYYSQNLLTWQLGEECDGKNIPKCTRAKKKRKKRKRMACQFRPVSRETDATAAEKERNPSDVLADCMYFCPVCQYIGSTLITEGR